MVNIKENLWIILISAGILGIISLFTPSLYISSENASIWVWNLYVSSSYVGFVQTDEILFTLGVIATILITIGTLITFFSGIILKIRNKRLNLISLIGGVLILLGPIIYLGGISTETNVWDYLSINVGSILPFFAGSIPFILGDIGLIKSRS
ncbi:MAG: hypothetical protein ACFE9Z_17500 [Promethearchaeota archaeon]